LWLGGINTNDATQVDPVTAIDQAITLARRLRDISKNVAEVEFKNVLADLSNELADAKLEIVALKEQVAATNEELRLARIPSSTGAEKPTIKWGAYEFPGEDGLFCTACYDTKRQKIHTTRLNSQYRQCPVCKALLGG
jgi:hypothetical protein